MAAQVTLQSTAETVEIVAIQEVAIAEATIEETGEDHHAPEADRRTEEAEGIEVEVVMTDARRNNARACALFASRKDISRGTALIWVVEEGLATVEETMIDQRVVPGLPTQGLLLRNAADRHRKEEETYLPEEESTLATDHPLDMSDVHQSTGTTEEDQVHAEAAVTHAERSGNQAAKMHCYSA